MNIRPKVMILLTLVFVLLSAGAILIQERVVMPSFARLEQTNALIAMHRVRHAMDRNLEALEVNAKDWANWKDIYDYVQDHNTGFVTANVTQSSLAQLQIDELLIVDLEGHVVLCSSEHLSSPVSLASIVSGNDLRPDFPWRQYLGKDVPARGLIKTNLGVLLIASAPILDGFGAGPVRGTVIMGRLLTAPLVQRTEAQTETTFSMVTNTPEGSDDRVVTSSSMTQIFGSFPDVYGKPVMTLRVDVPRDITANGRRAILIAAASLVGAAMVTLVLLMALLNRYVLAPLSRLTRHAVAVGENPENTEPLGFKTEDEFGKLASEFDGMVLRLAQTRRDLVDQSFEAGFAEMAKGVLHNLGNALTPMGVRLSAMDQRVRESPAADLEVAVAELAKPNGDPARRAELLEFVALGCREMAQSMQDTAADIELMQRQASLMQASLSEQMRGASHKAPILESVKLPDLITPVTGHRARCEPAPAAAGNGRLAAENRCAAHGAHGAAHGAAERDHQCRGCRAGCGARQGRAAGAGGNRPGRRSQQPAPAMPG